MDAVPLIDSYTAEVFANMRNVTIQQQTKMLEAITQGCIEQKNAYRVFDTATGYPLFIVSEESGDCTRCFCAPNHSLYLNFKVLNPDGSLNTTMQPVLTLERKGTECSCDCRKAGLGCFACMDCCRDGMKFHAGSVGTVDEIGDFPEHACFGKAEVPFLGGGCSPMLQVMERTKEGFDEENPQMLVEGPGCCFGGCMELCLDTQFPASKVPFGHKGHLNVGDAALITKRKPSTFTGAITEALTDSDTYTVEFNDPNMTPQQKVNIIATTFLLDYQFFERDNGMCECRDGKLHITCCLSYICGCVCPCTITLGGEDNSGGSS